MPRRVLTLVLGAVIALLVPLACGGGDGGSSSGGTGGAAAASGGTGGASARGGGSGRGGTSGNASAGAAGDGDGPLCPAFAPCGGDPDGEWNARAACIEDLDPMPEPGCEGAVSREASLEGTYTFFGETNKLLTDVVLKVTVMLDVNDTCAHSLSGAATAEIACPLLEDQYADSPQYESVSCEMIGAGHCHCDLVAPPQVQQVLNMYTVVGDRIVDTDGDSVSFCRDDDTLGIYVVEEQTDMALTLWFDRAK